MTRIHVFCEGQTEDVFTRELLGPALRRSGIWVNPIIIRTGPQGKGGITRYGKIRWQIQRKCQEDPKAFVTTFFDLYGLPSDFPAFKTTSIKNPIERAKRLEKAFQDDIDQDNFIAHLVVHEFEGLLFSETRAFSNWFDESGLVEALDAIRHQFETPEHINDSFETAPSKRIKALCPSYDKVAHGSLLALDIGVDSIRESCPLFDDWLKQLEALAAR